MTDLRINADSEAVRDALEMFLSTYKEQVCEYINLELRDKGQLVDSGMTKNGDVLTFHQVAEDKGFVLAETGGFPPVEIQKYTTVGEDELFIRSTKNGLTLFIKSESGIPDVKIGEFKTIDDAVTEFNSDSVTKAVLAARESKKQQLKQIKKLKKLGKLEGPDSVQEAISENDVRTEETAQLAGIQP